MLLTILCFLSEPVLKKKREKVMETNRVGISSFRRPQTAKPASKSKPVITPCRPKSSKSSTSVEWHTCPTTSGSTILRFSLSENCLGVRPKSQPKTAKAAKKWGLETIDENKIFAKSRPATAPPARPLTRPNQRDTQVWLKKFRVKIIVHLEELIP